jgi:hypothetical protein
MKTYTVFPNSSLSSKSYYSEKFRSLGLNTFHDACHYVHELPYGYNSTREDGLIIFKEGYGSCTTKHGVIAALAEELNFPVYKMIGIYGMTEELVTGTKNILEKYHLPYIPMVHCFLSYDSHYVDLTLGNATGKNHPIDEFLIIKKVSPMISEKEEYILYKRSLENQILQRKEMVGIQLRDVLHARAEGIKLLHSKVDSKIKSK